MKEIGFFFQAFVLILSPSFSFGKVTRACFQSNPYERPALITLRTRPTQTLKKNKIVKKFPPLLEEVETKYSKAETLIAKFTQINKKPVFNQQTTSSGLVMFKRPNKVRWETLRPDKSILVSDGQFFWFYTPPFDVEESGQYSERKFSEVQSKLAHALLSGAFSIVKDMKIRQTSSSEFSLYPKKGSAGTVIRTDIAIDLEEKLVQKITLEHNDGNRSEITLSKIELGKLIEEGLFIFVPPPNTDRID